MNEIENGMDMSILKTNTENKPEPPKKSRAKKSTRSKKVKERTLEEFKNWLEGLQEFQDEGWIPNLTQWEYIKSSIYAIKEDEYYYDDQPTQQRPSSYNNNNITPSVPPTSGLDSVNYENQPKTPILNFNDPNKLKQDIDTSNGQYKSDFE